MNAVVFWPEDDQERQPRVFAEEAVPTVRAVLASAGRRAAGQLIIKIMRCQVTKPDASLNVPDADDHGTREDDMRIPVKARHLPPRIGTRKERSPFPAEQGIAPAKETWMTGIGLGPVTGDLTDRPGKRG